MTAHTHTRVQRRDAAGVVMRRVACSGWVRGRRACLRCAARVRAARVRGGVRKCVVRKCVVRAPTHCPPLSASPRGRGGTSGSAARAPRP
eukprot:5654509-Prymnesium_polylepis.1